MCIAKSPEEKGVRLTQTHPIYQNSPSGVFLSLILSQRHHPTNFHSPPLTPTSSIPHLPLPLSPHAPFPHHLTTQSQPRTPP